MMYIAVNITELPDPIPEVAAIAWQFDRLEADNSITSWQGWESDLFTEEQVAAASGFSSYQAFNTSDEFRTWILENGAVPEEEILT